MILLKNCNIFEVYKGKYFKGDILIDGKKIKEVDKKIDAAGSDIKIEDVGGRNVLPGFIDAHSHIGTWTLRHNGNDANECVTPATPALRIIDALDPCCKAFYDAYSSGITSVMITPGSGNVIGGQCAVIKTYGKTKDEMIIKFPAALKMAFGENPKNVYSAQKKSPSSRMATAAIIRDMLRKAQIYMEKKKYDPLCYDMDLEAFIPVLRHEIPVKMHAHRADDIMTAIRIAEEFKIEITLDHCTEGSMITDYIKDKNIPVLIGPSGMFRSKYELRNAAFETAGILSKVGISVSIISDHPFQNCKYLPVFAGILAKHGLGEAEALRALTINPAKALRMEDRIGSIEKGKDADIVIFDGNPLEILTKAYKTIINGKIVYESK